MSAGKSETTTTNVIDLNDVIDNITDLPSIPETLIQILKVLDDPDSGPSDLAKVVRLDAPLMVKVLRLANSPYYSPRGDISDINRCVAVLGYRTVRQVAICVTVATSLVSAVAQTKGRLDYRELWRHSVVTAAISKHLAQMVDYPDPEEAFTSGLLHDIGKFVLEIHAPETYDRVIQTRAELGCPLRELEEETFGFNHATIGGAFGSSWRFPANMVQVFSKHHSEGVGSGNSESGDQLLALVSLADFLANTMVPSPSDFGFDPRLVDTAQLYQRANLSVQVVEDNLDSIRESVQLASAYLELS